MPRWKQDVDIVVGEAAAKLAYVTIPKATRAAQVEEVIGYVQRAAAQAGMTRPLPVHVLIETHGALAEVFKIAALPQVQVLDFGQMDFVSGHHGAIPASAMRSPGQFEHALLVRAKAEVVAAALSHGVVPAHNVCLNLKDGQMVYADAQRARSQFGFLRMWSIHPAQIRPIVDAMKPGFEEVQDAAEILLRRAGRRLGADPVPGRAARPRDLPLFLERAGQGPGHRSGLARQGAAALFRRLSVAGLAPCAPLGTLTTRQRFFAN